jgi:methylphosphotriester-DNA--protein-cysteine methyltransferase
VNDLEPIGTVCRYIEQHSDEPLTLDALAAMAGLSKYHFARRFKAVVGVTLKEYASAARLRRLKDGLKTVALSMQRCMRQVTARPAVSTRTPRGTWE